MPIYLRREPTLEPYPREPGKLLPSMCRAVVAYEDPDAATARIRWHWTRADKPDTRWRFLQLP